ISIKSTFDPVNLVYQKLVSCNLKIYFHLWLCFVKHGGLIRRYLESGVMINGIKVSTEEGTPQGGPLSPLLANIMLDELDKELEKRGHKFCRYADDCNIYVKSRSAGNRVMKSIKKFIESKLKLKVNEAKSSCR
ncbi:RNA-directed DNA polymerase (Reverse transcriptase), partial [Thermoanaerobacter ethanolicus JW 200]